MSQFTDCEFDLDSDCKLECHINKRLKSNGGAIAIDNQAAKSRIGSSRVSQRPFGDWPFRASFEARVMITLDWLFASPVRIEFPVCLRACKRTGNSPDSEPTIPMLMNDELAATVTHHRSSAELSR